MDELSFFLQFMQLEIGSGIMQFICISTLSLVHLTSHRSLRACGVPVGLMGYSVLLDAHLLSNVHLKGPQRGLKCYAETQEGLVNGWCTLLIKLSLGWTTGQIKFNITVTELNQITSLHSFEFLEASYHECNLTSVFIFADLVMENVKTFKYVFVSEHSLSYFSSK